MHVQAVQTVPASIQARREDPRVFPFGNWLRRHSLDELPQFLNVLNGEMSVVGPRPHFVEHTDVFAVESKYHIRSFVKPGITGLAQVNGCRGEVRSPEDIEHRVRWDIRYVQQWTLAMDVWLIIRTAGQVLRPPNQAY
jgi:lipopolysaccharide/colanic/teichoic acid biosynthesis glycosyltransferase